VRISSIRDGVECKLASLIRPRCGWTGIAHWPDRHAQPRPGAILGRSGSFVSHQGVEPATAIAPLAAWLFLPVGRASAPMMPQRLHTMRGPATARRWRACCRGSLTARLGLCAHAGDDSASAVRSESCRA
jgi:hypothetical protein